ncbi:MAG: helix-turn-helix transcriptional regulator [Oscillospiraceae bacterium]|nr:helix-turn-helix transcriptional regulator [Oscillospiraceae bacterium]
MQLSELKLISASNIIKLRTGAGLTQAELGEKLNYSDKTISKWERGEAIPDAYVLTQMAEIFGVTVDYLLSSHDAWESPEQQAARQEEAGYSVNMIIAISVLGVWTMALTIFVLLWLFDIILWETFIVALPVSILTYMVLICVFRRRQHLQFVIAAFVLSMFILLYFTLPMQKPWQLFLIAIPAEIIVFLSCNIRRRPRKKPEN